MEEAEAERRRSDRGVFIGRRRGARVCKHCMTAVVESVDVEGGVMEVSASSSHGTVREEGRFGELQEAYAQLVTKRERGAQVFSCRGTSVPRVTV